MTNEERVAQVHERVNEISNKLYMIIGGAVVAGAIGFIAWYHINFRFSNIEKSLEQIEKKVTTNQCRQPEIKITSVSP